MTRLTEQEYANFIITRGRRAQKTVDRILEKPFQQNVKDLAHMLGWKTYHTLNSKGSDEDFPDLVLVRRRPIPLDRGTLTRLIVAELKIEGKKPTVGQQEWLDFFREIGAETYAWQPSDWETIQKVLR